MTIRLKSRAINTFCCLDIALIPSFGMLFVTRIDVKAMPIILISAYKSLFINKIDITFPPIVMLTGFTTILCNSL